MKTYAHLKAVVPKARLATKVQKTVMGLGFVALGIWLVKIGATETPASIWLIGIGVALCIFGALGASDEVALAPFWSALDRIVDAFKKAKG